MTNSFVSIRDQLTEFKENYQLSFGNQFYFDKGGLNLGYGFCITKNLANRQFIKDVFAAGGLSFNSDQIAAIVNAARYPAAIEGQATALTGKLNGITSAGAINFSGITLEQAAKMMDYYYDHVVDSTTTTGGIPHDLGLSIGQLSENQNVWAALQDLVYNAKGALNTPNEVPNLIPDVIAAATAGETGNWGKALFDIAANRATEVPTRRSRAEIAIALGVTTDAVKCRLKGVFLKLDAGNQEVAVLKATTMGLIPVGHIRRRDTE